MKVLIFCCKGFETMEFTPFVDDYDALAIPGGFENFGFYEEAYDERFLNLIAEFDKQKKYIASICVGALPIGKSGVLTGRNATTYHLSGGNRQQQLAAFGVNVIPDQRIVKELHNIPERSMHEVKTKQTLIHFIETHTQSLEIVDMDQWFYVVKKGKCDDHPIAFRADYDAVTCADGCPRHLCGHDGHSAVLAGFSLWLDTAQLERDVYLIFQPGEENGMGAAICVSLIEEKNIEEIYGFHNLPGYPCGEVVLLNHTFACASTGLEIKFQGKQSHAAYPENGRNPANAIAEIIQSMNAMIQEKHKGIVLGTVIGIEAGSHSYGVSAGEGMLRLTLRAEYQDEYDTLVTTIEDKAKALAIAQGLSVEILRVEEFPATINDKECVDKIWKIAHRRNQEVTYAKEPFRWSEDFGYYLQKTRGAFIGVGCGVDHPALHTMEYEFDDEIIESVIEIYKEISQS